MSSFAKLVPQIIESSIWNEPAEIRVVWITMLAKKHHDTGYVRGDARTISRLANVSLEATEKALELFQKPDPTSHTPDNEGRRIAPADGGWIILNNDKYVEYGMRDDKRAIWREQKRQQKLKKKESSAVVPGTFLENSRITLDLISCSSPEGVQGEVEKAWKPNAEQLRLNALFNHRPTTPWSAKMVKAWKAITPIDESDMKELERHFAYKRREGDKFGRHTSLDTLLNNFHTAVGWARQFREPTCL